MNSAAWLSTWWLPSRLMEHRGTIGIIGEPWVLQGMGVTAFDAGDAVALVLDLLEAAQLPTWLGQPELCAAVPEHLLQPHRSPLTRGVWYPAGHPDARAERLRVAEPPIAEPYSLEEHLRSQRSSDAGRDGGVG